MPGASLPVKGLIFRQLFEKESSTYSYLLADAENGEGVIIDPVLETVRPSPPPPPCRSEGMTPVAAEESVQPRPEAICPLNTILLATIASRIPNMAGRGDSGSPREGHDKRHFAIEKDPHRTRLPTPPQVARDGQLAKELGVTLKYGINTHAHADHITGTCTFKENGDAMQSVISEASGAAADVRVKHGDVIKFGRFELECRATPGHTDGCMSYVFHEAGMVFTGDALLIRGCGRTDFQQGSSEKLYASIHGQVFTLPDDYVVYPGHDYKGHTSSTVGEEKRLNPRLTRDLPGFVKFMAELNLPPPKKLDASLPANMRDGCECAEIMG